MQLKRFLGVEFSPELRHCCHFPSAWGLPSVWGCDALFWEITPRSSAVSFFIFTHLKGCCCCLLSFLIYSLERHTHIHRYIPPVVLVQVPTWSGLCQAEAQLLELHPGPQLLELLAAKVHITRKPELSLDWSPGTSNMWCWHPGNTLTHTVNTCPYALI